MHRICIIAVCYLSVFVAVYVVLGEVGDQRFTIHQRMSTTSLNRDVQNQMRLEKSSVANDLK